MPHIDPRLDPRRAKMLDVARASVSGRRNPSYARRVQLVRQRRRAREKQQLAGLRDVRCSLTIDCNCAICDAVDRITGPAPNWDKFVYCGFICWHPVDGNRPGLRVAYEALCRFDGEFDPWYSWLKANLPDTVAGRHLLDHIIQRLWCYGCWWPAGKNGNHHGCTCGEIARENELFEQSERHRARQPR